MKSTFIKALCLGFCALSANGSHASTEVSNEELTAYLCKGYGSPTHEVCDYLQSYQAWHDGLTSNAWLKLSPLFKKGAHFNEYVATCFMKAFDSVLHYCWFEKDKDPMAAEMALDDAGGLLAPLEWLKYGHQENGISLKQKELKLLNQTIDKLYSKIGEKQKEYGFLVTKPTA